MHDFFKHLHEPAAHVFRQAVDHLAEHRLGDDQFAHHIDDAIDLFQLDPRRCRAPAAGALDGAPCDAAVSLALPAAFAADRPAGRRMRRARPELIARQRCRDRRRALRKRRRQARRRQIRSASPSGSLADAIGAAGTALISSSQSPSDELEYVVDLRRVAGVRNVPVQPIYGRSGSSVGQ